MHYTVCRVSYKYNLYTITLLASGKLYRNKYTTCTRFPGGGLCYFTRGSYRVQGTPEMSELIHVPYCCMVHIISYECMGDSDSGRACRLSLCKACVVQIEATLQRKSTTPKRAPVWFHVCFLLRVFVYPSLTSHLRARQQRTPFPPRTSEIWTGAESRPCSHFSR